MVRLIEDTECNSQADFDKDEEKLVPERESEHEVFAIFHAQSLVLSADEDGAEDVADAIREELVSHGNYYDQVKTYMKTPRHVSCLVL